MIEELEPLADNPEGQDLMEAVSKLEKATQDYLDTRPSNWMTIRNGALWVETEVSRYRLTEQVSCKSATRGT